MYGLLLIGMCGTNCVQYQQVRSAWDLFLSANVKYYDQDRPLQGRRINIIDGEVLRIELHWIKVLY